MDVQSIQDDQQFASIFSHFDGPTPFENDSAVFLQPRPILETVESLPQIKQEPVQYMPHQESSDEEALQTLDFQTFQDYVFKLRQKRPLSNHEENTFKRIGKK